MSFSCFLAPVEGFFIPELEHLSLLDKARELGKDLEFEVIWNDGSRKSLEKLVHLKNIFATQLPKMPKEYIMRLVFDRNHKTLCMSQGEKIIGGVCFRPFYSQEFAEIVFLAVTSDHQVKGYGTVLMNHLKEFVKLENIKFFLTYADNYAIGYFKKQGFTKYQTMPRNQWFGFIKDYDGGTLMECRIQPCVNYLALKETMEYERAILNQKMEQISRSHIVHEPVPAFLEGKSEVQVQEIPGVLEAGWSPSKQPTSGASTTAYSPLTELSARLAGILKQIRSLKDAWPFLEPVDPKQVPDYRKVIKNPMGTALHSLVLR